MAASYLWRAEMKPATDLAMPEPRPLDAGMIASASGWLRAAQARLRFRRVTAADAPLLLRDLLDEAARSGKAVSIHVEKFNPAMRLYQRLGFMRIEDRGVYDLMQSKSPAPIR